MSLERIAALLDGPFGYSRALAPDLRVGLRSLPGSMEMPFVRGRIVVPDDFERSVVVGSPNYLGVFEDQMYARAVYLTSRWSRLQSLPDDALTVAVEPSAVRHLATEALGRARLLAKRLRQLRGVQVVFKPQSPILIVLAPRVCRIVDQPPGLSLLGGSYPELPGGFRIELPPDALPDELNRYAASLAQTIIQEA